MKKGDSTDWVPLPKLPGGIYVAMVTEVLDQEKIPNLVKTDLAAGGIGVVTGTTTVGMPWRILVPRDRYEEALHIFESIAGHTDGLE
ncbi:MAG: hypothetical protein V1784_12615 [bacterium]